MIPGRREPNKMSQMIAPTYWLEKLSKLQCRKQEPSQKNEKQKTQRIPSSGDSAESRKTQSAGICRAKCQRGDSCMENSRVSTALLVKTN